MEQKGQQLAVGQLAVHEAVEFAAALNVVLASKLLERSRHTELGPRRVGVVGLPGQRSHRLCQVLEDHAGGDGCQRHAHHVQRLEQRREHVAHLGVQMQRADANVLERRALRKVLQAQHLPFHVIQRHDHAAGLQRVQQTVDLAQQQAVRVQVLVDRAKRKGSVKVNEEEKAWVTVAQTYGSVG